MGLALYRLEGSHRCATTLPGPAPCSRKAWRVTRKSATRPASRSHLWPSRSRYFGIPTKASILGSAGYSRRAWRSSGRKATRQGSPGRSMAWVCGTSSRAISPPPARCSRRAWRSSERRGCGSTSPMRSINWEGSRLGKGPSCSPCFLPGGPGLVSGVGRPAEQRRLSGGLGQRGRTARGCLLGGTALGDGRGAPCSRRPIRSFQPPCHA